MSNNKNPFSPRFIKDFDEEASEFLRHYECADAIETPMVIPIRQIAQQKMTLTIVEGESLSHDGSVHGAITFMDGLIDVYDWTSMQYVGYQASGGSLFVDVDSVNEGQINNILAHECFHWYKHRLYYIYANSHGDSGALGFRCHQAPTREDDVGQWADEDRMEYQARAIAPKILMPKLAAGKKLEELYCSATNQTSGMNRDQITYAVLLQFAEFFHVSKQSAAIRMVELGYTDADRFCAYDTYAQKSKRNKTSKSSSGKRQQLISTVEAFRLYLENPFLREILNTGKFCFVDQYFVRNEAMYLHAGKSGRFELTEYAKEHLVECTLDFSTKLIPCAELSKQNMGVLYRKDISYRVAARFDPTAQNIEQYNQAVVANNIRADFEKQFALQKEVGESATQRCWRYIKAKKWNTSIFQDRTLLSPMDYTRVQNPDHIFKIPAYVAMAVGLELTLNATIEMLGLSGLGFDPNNRDHSAYQYVLATFHGAGIDECNEVLELLEAPQLGTKSRA